MGVYLDNSTNILKGRSEWPMVTCHMIADSVEELFDMANKIGMRPEWFQPWSHPHFDVSKSRQTLALAQGARRLERREFVTRIRAYRKRILEDRVERERLWELVRRYGGDRRGA